MKTYLRIAIVAAVLLFASDVTAQQLVNQGQGARNSIPWSMVLVAPTGNFSAGVTGIGATLTQIVTAPASGSIYLTDIFAVSDTGVAGQMTFRYGTGANCVTGTTTILPNVAAITTGKLPYPANTANSPFYQTMATPLKIPALNALCVICIAVQTCTVHVQGFVAL